MNRESLTIQGMDSVAGLRTVTGTGIQNEFPSHAHGDLCIGSIIEGSRRMNIAGKKYLLSAGDMFVVNPREAHNAEPVDKKPHSYAVLVVPDDIATAIFAGPAGCGRPPFANIIRGDPGAGSEFLALCKLPKKTNRPELIGHLVSLMTYLAARHPAPPRTGGPPYPHNAVKTAKEYIDAHFRDHIPLELLSEMTDTSPYHLNRVFTDEAGMPPHAYQIHRRIEKSKTLLLEGRTISYVSAESGFTDQSHYTKFFKRITGTTPGRFIACNTSPLYA